MAKGCFFVKKKATRLKRIQKTSIVFYPFRTFFGLRFFSVKDILNGVNPDTISIPHGWPGRDNVNYLVGDALRDPIVGTPAYKAVPCNVVKAE